MNAKIDEKVGLIIIIIIGMITIIRRIYMIFTASNDDDDDDDGRLNIVVRRTYTGYILFIYICSHIAFDRRNFRAAPVAMLWYVLWRLTRFKDDAFKEKRQWSCKLSLFNAAVFIRFLVIFAVNLLRKYQNTLISKNGCRTGHSNNHWE